MAVAEDDQQAVMAADFRSMADLTTRKLPLYRRICDGASTDPEVIALLGTADPQQRRPVLLLAAVHDALLAGADHDLARFYSSVTPEPAAVGEPGSADDPWPAFRDFALSDPAVAQSVASRSTQTNEVNRCGALLPAFTTVAAAVDKPLGLVELGASAGLNLLFDRYSYEFGDDGSFHPASGASPVVVSTTSHGPERIPIPAAVLPVDSRQGIDLAPVDLGDPAAARWLVACLWPEQEERLARVRHAIELARIDPPAVVQGDLVEDVTQLIAGIDDGVEPLLFATWVLTYLHRDRQAALFTTLDVLGAKRDLSLVFAERLDEVPALPSPKRADGVDDARFTALVWVRWVEGRRIATRLGDLHPHGSWLAWSHPAP